MRVIARLLALCSLSLLSLNALAAPVPGLYQTGACTHPGGSVSGAPGRNAAMVMLKDLGSSLEAAIGGAERAA